MDATVKQEQKANNAKSELGYWITNDNKYTKIWKACVNDNHV